MESATAARTFTATVTFALPKEGEIATKTMEIAFPSGISKVNDVKDSKMMELVQLALGGTNSRANYHIKGQTTTSEEDKTTTVFTIYTNDAKVRKGSLNKVFKVLG